MTSPNGTTTLHDGAKPLQADAYEWVSVEEAARRHGTSPSTIRRMIRDGSLTGELQDRSARDRRQQFLVRLPLEQTAPDGATIASDDVAPPGDDGVRPHQDPRQAASEPRHDAPSAATTGPEATALAFVAELAAVRQVADARADQLVTQAVEVGQLRAERDAARNDARIASERATAAEQQVAELERRRWWRWW